MPLIDNTNFLRQNFKTIYDKYIEYHEVEGIDLIEAINGSLTLLVQKASNAISLHSKYNPEEEANIILEEYKENMHKYEHVLFYGIGLGYIVDNFAKTYPDKSFSIYEPVEDLFYTYIDNKKMSYKNLKNVCTGENENEIKDFLKKVFKYEEKGILFLFMPSHKRIYEKQYNQFTNRLNIFVKDKRVSLMTEYTFQKKWITNSVNNFEYTINTPDIFAENSERFKGKVGILVAAGPSLDFELENLKYIKENNMAYIFSISTATNILLKNNIEPHAITSYDPGEGNMNGVFRKIIEDNMDRFPLIYGSSISTEVLQSYNGPMIHMLTQQDTIAQYYLQDTKGKKFNVVTDAASIAVLTLELFYRLGCSKVILVGQNFAYYKEEYYAAKLDSDRDIHIEKEKSSFIKVKDVYGNAIDSDIKFLNSKKQMELYVQLFNTMQIINTTKGGAKIEGTSFRELKDIIEKELVKDDIDPNFYELHDTDYDLEYTKDQKNIMDKSYKAYRNMIENIRKILDKMKVLVRNNNYKQLKNMYSLLNTLYFKVQENCFFNVFVLPINRVSYTYLGNKLEEVKQETNPFKIADTIINGFTKFLMECEKSLEEDIDYMYEKVNKVIEENTGEMRGGYKIFEAELIIE